MVHIVVKLAPGESVEKGDCIAGGTVITAIPGEQWVVVDRDEYAVAAFDDDPKVMEHRPERIARALVVPEHAQEKLVTANFSPGDTFPMIGINEATQKQGSWGQDVAVAIVDTGVYQPHVAFNGKNFDGDTTDSHGHGTHVASTAASAWGIASDAVIVVRKALPGQGGTGTESDVANAIMSAADWMVTNRALGVMNLSLGGLSSGVIDSAVRYAQARGVWICAAAGNDGPGATIGSPARVADFVIGAVDRNSQIASFSSGGGSWQQITMYMPGVQIVAAAANTPNGTMVMSGTSMATPHAVGVCAYLRKAGMDLSTARAYIYAHESNIGAANRKGLFVLNSDYMGGTPPPSGGSLDKEAYVGILHEVDHIVDGAQQTGWSSPDVRSQLGSIKDYMTQLDGMYDEEQSNGIREEVRNIITHAQETGWSSPEVRSQLGSIRDYAAQLEALLPTDPQNPPPPPPPPPLDDSEDWTQQVSGAAGLVGETKWAYGNGSDVFVPRNTLARAPHDCVVTFTRIVTLPGMTTGEMLLTYPDGRCVRYRHTEATVANGASVKKDDVVGRIYDPSMDLLHWPSNYPKPPDGYQHIDISLATSAAGMNPAGGQGGNVNAYAHIWGKMGGIPNITVIPHTPGPPEGQSGFATEDQLDWSHYGEPADPNLPPNVWEE